MKDKIIKLLDDWKVNKHKQELIADELLILCGVGVRSEQLVNCLKEWENVDSKEDVDALRDWVSKRPRLTN